jgi:hypothetical protein
MISPLKRATVDDKDKHWVLLLSEDPLWLPWLDAAAVALVELDARSNPNPTVDIPSTDTIKIAVSFSAPDLSMLPSPRYHFVSLQFYSYVLLLTTGHSAFPPG